MTAPVMLLIRDGWGINPGGRAAAAANGDATLLARTSFHDELYRKYPGSRLSASGLDVGLPAGQMGNSEVGHMNLGAGRIVYQDLTRINKGIAEPVVRDCISSGSFPMEACTATSRTWLHWPMARKQQESLT
jgi:bisphosphoglycerate-independent phosphoglycerate mutase (AlkP superfamily)